MLAVILFLLRSPRTAPSALSDVVSTGITAQAAGVEIPKGTQLLLLALELVSGFLFGSGLVVSGMVNPAKVLCKFDASSRLLNVCKVTAFLSALPSVYAPTPLRPNLLP